MDKIAEKIGFFAVLLTTLSISTSPHPVLLVLSYIVHELGHVFFAKIVGVNIKKLKIGSFRLSISYDCSGLSYKRELMVCLGGIIFNLISALSMLAFVKNNEIAFFVACNFSLAIMNLYPITTLDGGRTLRCVLMCFLSAQKALTIAKVLSFIAVFLLWLCAVYLQLVFNSNVSLFFISVFLLIQLCFSD